MKKKQWIGIVVAGVVFIAVCATGILSNVVQSKLTEKADTKSKTSTSEMLSSIWGSSEENVTGGVCLNCPHNIQHSHEILLR